MIEKNDTVLRKTPLFANLTATGMGALAGRVNKRRFDRGALFFSEGDPCTGLFLVALGKIQIVTLGGREQVPPWSRAAHSQSFRSLMEVIIRPRRVHWRSASEMSLRSSTD